MLQVNVKLPDDAPVGGGVPLTLRFDGDGGAGYNSQPDVTFAVR